MFKPLKNIIYFSLAIAAVVVVSCSKTENEELPDLKKDYYPVSTGHSITYQVDSTVYDKFTNSKKDYSFQIKDTVLTEIESGANTKTVYIERYKKNNGETEWKFQKVISRNITDLRAEEFIDNQRFVRMVFPPVKNNTWNGNTYNNLEKQEYSYKSVDKKDTVNNLSFDSIAVIVQADETNLLREDYAEEHYAKHIGLVKKYVKSIEKDFYTQKTTNGSVYTMRIISTK